MSSSFSGRALAFCLGLVLATAPSVLVADTFVPATNKQIGFSASALTGVQGTHRNTMAMGSAMMPVTSRAIVQLDFGTGIYRDEYQSLVGAARVFWRTGKSGAMGVYADYASVSPEHAGRMGLEGSFHFDRFTIEALVGARFGTNVYTAAFDEIDISYYFADDLKGSVGHRWTSRGHVANVAFEYAPSVLSGWTVFGEAEVGEDDNHSAYAGIRYSFGAARHPSLMERDRKGPMRIRVPRGINDVTRCGAIDEKRPATFGLREMSVLCASANELRDEGAEEEKKD